jgi:hypothetical protein
LTRLKANFETSKISTLNREITFKVPRVGSPGAFKRYGSSEFNWYSRPAVRFEQLEPKEVGQADHRAVALQVAFERQTLKPVFHLIGYRLWV